MFISEFKIMMTNIFLIKMKKNMINVENESCDSSCFVNNHKETLK